MRPWAPSGRIMHIMQYNGMGMKALLIATSGLADLPLCLALAAGAWPCRSCGLWPPSTSLKLRVHPRSPMVRSCGVKDAVVVVSLRTCGPVKDAAACLCTADVGSSLMPGRCRVQHKHLGHDPDHCTAASEMGRLSHMHTTCCDLERAGGWLGRRMGAKAARPQRTVDVLLLAGCACLQQSALTTMVVFQLDVSRSQGIFCSLIRSNEMSVKLQSVTAK